MTLGRREFLSTAVVAGGLTAVAGLNYAQAGDTPPPQPEKSGRIRVGRVSNLTGKNIYAHISSFHGEIRVYVRADDWFYYNYIDDGKKRVLAAFSSPNELITFFDFEPRGDASLVISETDAPPTSSEYEPPKDPVTTVPV